MTPRIHLHVLASGSKGNAAIVEGPDGMVLVDCGLSWRELCRRTQALGLDADDLRAVLVTHEHSDHVSGLSVLCNHFAGPLFATAGTVAARGYLTELPFELVGHSDVLDLCGMRVTCFPTSHDVADPMGFRFEVEDDVLGFCTDTGVLGPEAMDALFGVRILALESNHDPHMLRTGPYPGYLKARIAGERGHLSNDQAAEALGTLADGRTDVVVGMHLSEKNNRPSLARRALEQAVGPDVSVCVASQTEPMSLW